MSLQRSLEVSVLASASKSRERMGAISKLLNGYRFSDSGLEWIWDKLKTAWKHGELPPLSSMQGIAQTEPEDVQDIIMEACVEIWKGDQSTSPVTDCATLQSYNRHDVLVQGMDRATKAVTRGDLDGAQAMLQRLSTETAAHSNIEISAVMDFDDWSNAEGVRGVETGLKTYDEVTMGGPRPGELGLIFGTTGMGKSMLATNFGFNSFKRRRRTLHIDTENGLQECQVRYVARSTRLPSRALTRRGLNYSEDFKQWATKHSNRIHEHLRIMHIGVEQATMDEVEAKIAELTADGWQPETIIFDSPDHVVFTGNEDNAGYVAKKKYERCKSITQKYEAVMWAVTQAKAEAEGKIATNKHAAWGYDKARLSDSVLTINPGLDDKGRPMSEKEMGSARSLFVSKARKSAGRFIIGLHTDLATAYIAEQFEGEKPEEESEE